jgi:hypothetical protein
VLYKGETMIIVIGLPLIFLIALAFVFSSALKSARTTSKWTVFNAIETGLGLVAGFGCLTLILGFLVIVVGVVFFDWK